MVENDIQRKKNEKNERTPRRRVKRTRIERARASENDGGRRRRWWTVVQVVGQLTECVRVYDEPLRQRYNTVV